MAVSAVGCLFFLYNGTSMHTHNLPSKSVNVNPWLSHVIVALAIITSTVISCTIWYGSNPSDDRLRRWILVAIPFVSAFGLLIGWRSAWRDTLLGTAVVYLFAPFIAARVESCWLPILVQCHVSPITKWRPSLQVNLRTRFIIQC
jgi:hypothetical protein